VPLLVPSIHANTYRHTIISSMKPQAYCSNNNSFNIVVDKSSTTMRRMTPMIIYGYIFNTLLYLLLAYIILPKTTTTPLGGHSIMAAASRYCRPTTTTMTTTADEARGIVVDNNAACTRRDLMAFQIVSFVNLSYLGLLGTYTFFLSKHFHFHPRYHYGRSSSTPISRCFGSLPQADNINAAIVIFQGWDFIMTYIFTRDDEYHTRRIVMLVHHAVAFICGYFCLIYEVRRRINRFWRRNNIYQEHSVPFG